MTTLKLKTTDVQPTSDSPPKPSLSAESPPKAVTLEQIPAGIHGSFSLNGIALIAPGVAVQNINPATGAFHTQVTRPSTGGCISPPPSRNFR